MMALVLTVLRKLVGFAGDVSDRVQTDAKPAVHVPEGADPSEYNAHGWIYNQAPYVRIDMKQTLVTAGIALAAVCVTYSLLLGYIREAGGMQVPGGIILHIHDVEQP